MRTRTIAECIDRYYKIHLKDEFKPTWRKMARLKRATEGRNKRNEESKVLATVTKVVRHRYDNLPRQDSAPAGSWRFPPVMSDERLKLVPPLQAHFDSNTQFPLASEDSLRGHARTNGRRRPLGSSPVQPLPLPMASPAGVDDAADPASLSPAGGIHLGDGPGVNHLLGPSMGLLRGGTLGPPPLTGYPPLAPEASLLPFPVPPTSKPSFQKVQSCGAFLRSSVHVAAVGDASCSEHTTPCLHVVYPAEFHNACLIMFADSLSTRAPTCVLRGQYHLHTLTVVCSG